MSSNKIPGPQTLDLTASRTIFKNNSGIKFNIYSKASRFFSRKKSEVVENERVPKNFDGNQYYEPGYKIDSDLVTTIQTKMDKHIDSKSNRVIKKSGKILSKHLRTTTSDPFLFHKNIPEVREVISDDVLDTARSYYDGAHILPIEVDLYRNFHIPPKMVTDGLISNHWHFDGDYPDILKVFINISDVSGKDGPLQFLPRRETINYVPEYEHPEGISDNIVRDNPELMRFTGDSGSIMFVNTNQCLHRAGIPEKNHSRDLLQIKLLPSTEPMSKNWLEEAEKFDLDEANRPPNTIIN